MADNLKAIVLAGGLGSRLKHLTADTPKPMVDVAGRPFLEYLLDNLANQGVADVVLAVSYLKEKIIEHFGSSYRDMALHYSVEETPLGTGGAIRQALDQYAALFTRELFIFNGDTYVDVALTEMLREKKMSEARFVMATKFLEDTGRYGCVEVSSGSVAGFQEKKDGASGLINAGVYLCDGNLLDDFETGSVFSFETDFLEKFASTIKPRTLETKGLFVDIGLPEDCIRASKEFAGRFARPRGF